MRRLASSTCAWALSGLLVAQTGACTRFHVNVAGSGPGATAPPPVAAVAFETWEADRDRREGARWDGRVLADLHLRRDGHWELVQRGDPAAWLRVDLIPGRYRLAVREASVGGQAFPFEGRRTVTFDVGDRQQARVGLVLRSFPWEAVAVAAVAVVLVVGVVAVVLYVISGGDGLPSLPSPPRVPPPPPLPEPPLPPPPGLDLALAAHHAAVEATLDAHVFVWVAPPVAPDAPPAPRVTHVRAPRPDRPDGSVWVEFDRPMDRDALDPHAISLEGPAGPVAGGVWTPDGGRSVAFHPLRPLPPGGYRLTVDADRLYDRDGVRLASDASVGFLIGTR